MAEEIAEIVKPTAVGLDTDGWGLDHGTWSVLVHAFPNADVPVVQPSINARQPFDWHVALGAKLASLRGSGVLIIGSGTSFTTSGPSTGPSATAGFDWARRFDDAARTVIGERPRDVLSLQSHPDFSPSGSDASSIEYGLGAAGRDRRSARGRLREHRA